jgi:DNA repair protein RadD
MFKLREYQKDAVKDAMNFIESPLGRSALLVLPTGAGKSLIIANIAKQLNQPVLVIQPSKELLLQNYDKYKSYKLEASIYSASVGVKEFGDVTFATPQSLRRQANLIKKNNIKVVIVDEAHYGSGVGQTLDNLCKSSEVAKIIGLTATPVLLANGMFGSELRMLNRTKKSLYQRIIHVTQIEHLYNNGYWSKLEYVPIKTDTGSLKLNASGSEYLEESVKKYYDENLINKQIVESCDNLIEEGKKHILCFVSLVDEAKQLQKMMSSYSVVIYGDMLAKDRDKAIKKFKEGKVKVAINVNVLGIGFDFPELDACVHARPTSSIAVYYQHIGRLVRIHENKESAKIIDLSSNYFRFGKLEKIRFEISKEANGWCMKSENKILTVFSRPDIEVTYKPKLKNKIQDFNSYQIPFGKYKDKKVTEVPVSYLKWIASNEFSAEFNSAIMLKQTAKKFLSQMPQQ